MIVLYVIAVLVLFPLVAFVFSGFTGAIAGAFFVGGSGCAKAGFFAGSVAGLIVGIPQALLHLIFGWPFSHIDATIIVAVGFIYGFIAARGASSKGKRL